MKLLTTFAMTLAMVAVTSAYSTADAQQYDNGYRFGAGLNYGHGHSNRCLTGLGLGRIGISPRVSEPPYFAKHPPVYYSHIVPRPYGISPYAAPPGISPIEMKVRKPKKKVVVNPFFKGEVAPASVEPIETDIKPEPKSDNKVTWLSNPYMGAVVKSD